MLADAVRVAFEFFSQRAALGFAIPEWLPTPNNMQYHSAVSRLDSAVYGIIADRQQRLKKQQMPPPKGSQVCHPLGRAASCFLFYLFLGRCSSALKGPNACCFFSLLLVS